MGLGQALDDALVVHQPRVQGVELERQLHFGPCVLGEAFDHVGGESLVGVAGVLPKLAVAGPLHQGDVIGAGGLGQPRRLPGDRPTGDLVLCIAGYRPHDLVEYWQGEWVSPPGKGGGQEDLVHVVADRPEDQAGGRLADIALADGGAGRRFAVVTIEAGIARAGGIGVHPVALQSDPARPEVAFLEDVHAQTAPLGRRDGGHVHLDAVIEDHQVGNLALTEEAVDPRGPRLFLVAIGRARPEEAPVRQVAAVEHDLADLEARLVKLIGDLAEERTEGPAQEQEVALTDRAAHYAVAAIGAPATRDRIGLCFAVAQDAVQHRGHTVIPSSRRRPFVGARDRRGIEAPVSDLSFDPLPSPIAQVPPRPHAAAPSAS